jgi:hypothetical protein
MAQQLHFPFQPIQNEKMKKMTNGTGDAVQTM